MTSALAPTGPASADVDAGVGPGVRPLAWLLLLGGVTGLLAAATLLVEKIALIADPAYVPSCSINPVLSCGSIMSTPQAELFGFPNPIIGVAAFPVLAATGAALLAGARLARWYWLGLQVGVVLGLALVGWLVFQSLYRIGALCPYCMVVWAVVVPVAFYVTSFNLRAGLLGGAAARSRAVRVVAESHVLVLAVVLVLVLALVLHRFWSYWVTVL
ncbi:vitamin K epoxide reductase family protein [Nocardioides sp. P86]|uniref:vitamin K epoxide reductase family protein n=1 Tax=Nocardioides sp. P86 TaxID=2939569 RepID=UPI00203F61A8|nr:vitamin K epoxide reductase family protein [Nocardioides sp. P86]MCM3515128.1 vitamin K epoxide reductase family protein [Nocardioides sp. P86]